MPTPATRPVVRTSLLAVATFVAAAAPTYAVHRESPPAIAVTTSGTHAISPGRSWDRNLAFSSTDDLLGTGSTGRQIFVFSLAEYDCAQGLTQDATVCPPPPWRPFRQVTTGTGAPDNPSVAVAGATVLGPDGDPVTVQRPVWVAFDAYGSYGGALGCSAACQQRRQIFLVNLLTNEVRRITSGTNGDSVRPSLSSGGGIVVFESTASLPGAPGAAGLSQLWVYERDTTFLRRITAGSTPSFGAVPSRDGTAIVFTSAAALLGDGHDTGILQIFAARYDRVAHQATLSQLTLGDGDSRHPQLAETQAVVYFDSDATDLPGGDDTAVPRVFSARLDAGPTPPVTQHTEADTFGACTFPTVDPSSSYLSMLCTGDPLQNGTAGSRVFTRELESGVLAQMTGFGDVQGPITASLGTFFLAFASTADVAGAGTCGRQVAVLDHYMTYPGQTGSVAKWIGATQPGQLPPDAAPPSQTHTTAIGKRLFSWQPGNGTAGSHESITTRDGTSTTPLGANGRFTFVIGAPNQFTGTASVGVPASGASFPPLPVAGFGALCVAATADGTGVLDCDGGDAGGDVLLRQDHDTDASDPLCLLGCREGASCQGGLPGPHQRPCPRCIEGRCNGGFNAGQPCGGDLVCQPTIAGRCDGGVCASGATPGKACVVDVQCAPISQCKNQLLGVCNGAAVATPTGMYAAGGMTAVLPLRLALSTDAGVDAQACTPDDVYAVTNVPARLHLTTGTATAAVSDADDLFGNHLAASVAGAPFDCDALRNRRMDDARLAATMIQLDLPNVPGLRDVIVGLRLAPSPADAGVCSCDGDDDCNDGNPCNGAGQCLAGVCIRTPMDCDDGNPCTEDGCDPVLGCSHVPLLDGSACDDGETCNGHETCFDTVCQPGVPQPDGASCDDANPCNGAATCASGACLPGAPLADGTACSDGNACNGVESCQSALCVPDAPLACDDQNPCTVDGCDPAAGCTTAALLDGTPCGSGDVCGGAPLCLAGVCETGTPMPEGAPCFDGDACSGAETCQAGQCTPAAGVDCDDGDPCTLDECDVETGCVHDPAPDGIPCASAAGGTGVCGDGACRAPKAPSCNDNNPCTGDAAGASGGCVHVALADGTACWQTNAGLCDGTATCEGGLCVVAPPPDCSDSDECTQDACDPGLGCVHVPVAALPGVVCRLASLRGVVDETPAASFRPASLRARLAKLLATARARAAVALVAKGRRRRVALRVAERALARFMRTVRNATARGKIDPAVADNLVASATGTRTMLVPLLQNPAASR